MPATFITGDRASLRFVDAGGNVIGEYSVNVSTNSDPQPGDDVTGLIDAVVCVVVSTDDDNGPRR